MKHTFHSQLDWAGGRAGTGQLQTEKFSTPVSIVESMDGPGLGTNPDELLLSAAESCYTMTLATMLERAGLPVMSLSVSSVGIVDVTDGVYTYESISHAPTLAFSEKATEQQKKKAYQLASLAAEKCMISRALAGNVTVRAIV